MAPLERNFWKPDQLYVDDITLSGRFKTELRTERKSTEGAHTIADVLIKKYQKDMMRGKPLNDAFLFYRNLANEVKAESSFIVKSAPNSNPADSRFDNSQQYADRTIRIIDENIGVTHTFREWNVIFKEIVSSYNNAYARSYQATLGVGTPGKGEGNGIKYGLKRTKQYMNYENPVPYENETRLIDMESVGQLDDENSMNMKDMQSMAGLGRDDAICMMRFQLDEIEHIQYNVHDNDMQSKINDLLQHMEQGDITSSDLTIARYLIMLGAIKARWREEEQMWERKGIRNNMDALGEDNSDIKKQLREVIIQKQGRTGELIENFSALKKWDFLQLVDSSKEVFDFVKAVRLLGEVQLSIFADAIEIIEQVGEIVENGIQDYVLGIKSEVEKIVNRPIPDDKFKISDETDIDVIPFLMLVSQEFMDDEICKQTEGAQNLWNLMMLFEEKVDIIEEVMISLQGT